jgi:excisionase family DNA binding protein
MIRVAEREKEVLNAEEAAELLDVSVWTIREAAHRGELPARKIGRAWRFSRQALLDHLVGGVQRAPQAGTDAPTR